MRARDISTTNAIRLALDTDSPVAMNATAMTVSGIISNAAPGRGRRDIVVTAGADLVNHMKTPVVLLEHYAPIGQARDEAGNYTVVAEGDVLRATTRFSQVLPEGEQAFRLCEEGILNGLSIGFIPKRFDYLIEEGEVPDWSTPRRFTEWEMFEYSHVVIGENPDAILDAVHKSFDGRPMTAALQQALLRHVPADRLTRTTVSLKENTLADSTSPVKRADDEDYVDTNDAGRAVDEPEEPADEQMTGPPGAQFLRGVHLRLSELATFVTGEGGSGVQENPDVLTAADEMAGMLSGMLDSLVETFSAIYPDEEQLVGPEPEDEPDGDEPPADEEGDDQMKKLAVRVARYRKSLQTRRLSKSARAVCVRAADFLDEVVGIEGDTLKASHRSAAELHSSKLRVVAAEPEDAADQEEAKAFAALVSRVEKLTLMNDRIRKMLDAARRGK